MNESLQDERRRDEWHQFWLTSACYAGGLLAIFAIVTFPFLLGGAFALAREGRLLNTIEEIVGLMR